MCSTPAEPPANGRSSEDIERNDLATAAKEWARKVAQTAYMPQFGGDIEQFFGTLLNRLIDALRSVPFSPEPAESIGADLVDAQVDTPEGLRATIESLTVPLLRLAESLDLPDATNRAVTVLSAVGAGYAAATRDRILEQQEDIQQALLQAARATQLGWERSEARFREVFARSAVGIAISGPDGDLLHVNPALGRMLGYAPPQLVGRPLRDFFHPEDAVNLDAECRDLGRGGGEPFPKRWRLLRVDGQAVWVQVAISPLSESEGVPPRQLTMIENVDELHLLQGRMSFQSLHDGLTWLPNRLHLTSQLAGLLANREPGQHVTLYHLDLDGFAVINDGLGVEIGDQMLSVVARRLEALFADEDALVARLAGDEFAVLIRSAVPRPNVITTIDRINEELSEPVHFDGYGGVSVSASFGVALCPVRELDPAELLRAADMTLRRAQASGKRQWAVYDADRDRRERRRLRLAAALPGALEFGELTQVWRPWVTLAGGRIFAVEARVRWDHAERGAIGHAQCVDAAEETGVTLAIGAWMLRTAAQRHRDWRERHGDSAPAVVVGLSSQQANDPDLASRVYDALTQVEMPPGELWVGVPTPALRAAGGEAWENIDVLTGMGVRVVLTDVGSAPCDLVHIEDRGANAVAVADWLVSRVRRAGSDSLLRDGVLPLLRMAKSAGADVVVPEVSEPGQADWWREAGATVLSGPIAGALADADEMTEFLERRLR